ncbi:MmyB family transcriptional regulator [Streptomyces koyangensis]
MRRSAGRYPDDPRLHRLVERLSERSEQFRELWRRPEVAEHGPTVERITHSEVGLLELDCDILRTHRGDLRIVTYSAEPGTRPTASSPSSPRSAPSACGPGRRTDPPPPPFRAPVPALPSPPPAASPCPFLDTPLPQVHDSLNGMTD